MADMKDFTKDTRVEDRLGSRGVLTCDAYMDGRSAVVSVWWTESLSPHTRVRSETTERIDNLTIVR